MINLRFAPATVITAALAIALATPSAAASQKATAQVRAVLQPLGAFQLSASVATPFDGRRVNGALARELAGNLELLGWANCATRFDASGEPIPSGQNRRTRASQPVPCVYLITGEPTDFVEHFLIPAACNDVTSRNQACMSGYTVDTRIRNRVTTSPIPQGFAMVRERTILAAAQMAGQIDTRAVTTQRRTVDRPSEQPASLRMEAVASVTCEMRFTPLTRRSECQAFGANRRPLGPPVIEEGFDYVAYSSLTDVAAATTGAASCADIGDFAEAQALNDAAWAGAVLGSLNDLGEGFGAAVGAIAGGSRAGEKGSAIGTFVGGAFVRVGTAPSEFAIEQVAPYRAALMGAVAEAWCKDKGMFEGNGPGAGTEPVFVPGTDRDGNIGADDGAMCWTCTRVRETTMTVTDNETGEVVETQTITVCIDYAWVPC